MGSFALLRRNRNFALVWLGGLVSLTGDWMLLVALPIYAYEVTGSTVATGTMLATRIVPRLLLRSVAGVFVDRWDRRQTLVVVNLALAVGLLPLLLVQSADLLWLIYGVAFVQACLAQFVVPAEGALLPRLVNAADPVAANALNTLNNNVARLIGPPVGGLAVAAGSLAGVALLDAISFLLAAVLIWLTRVDALPWNGEPAGRSSNAWAGVWQQWLDGLSVIRKSRPLSVVLAFIAITMVGEGVMGALVVPFVVETLGSDEVGVGWLLAAQAGGGLAGSLALSWWNQSWRPARMVAVGAVLLSLVDLMIFNYHVLIPGIVPALVLMVVVGAPVAAMLVGYSTLIQQSSTDEYRGRVIGAIGAVGALASLVGTALGGLLGERLGVVLVLNFQAIGYLAAGSMVWLTLATQGGLRDGTRVSRLRSQQGDALE